jgi:hypothetical protein
MCTIKVGLSLLQNIIMWTLCPNVQVPFLWTNYDLYLTLLYPTDRRHDITGLMFKIKSINNSIAVSCKSFLVTPGYCRSMNAGLFLNAFFDPPLLALL